MADVRLENALRAAEPELRQAFLQMVSIMGSAVPLSDLIDLLEAGRIDEALARSLASAPRLARARNEQFIRAANLVAQQINRRLGQIILDFDQTNEFVVNAMRQNQLRLVQGFTFQQRQATRRALMFANERGMNPRETARLFRQSIGLTDRQMQAVLNFRRAVEDLDARALARELRDRRFDRTLLSAMRRGDPLTPTQIQRMVDRYSERALRHRAEVIARTEALRAVHEGNHAMFQQAFQDGTLQPGGVIQEWNTALDERVRGSHSAMHGQTVPANELFTSGAGNRTQYPGGFGIAEEDIQCRCSVGTRITEAAMGNARVELIEEVV